MPNFWSKNFAEKVKHRRVHNTFKYFLSQGADPLGEIRVVMTTRTSIRFWFFGVFFELKPLLATKVICKQFITSIVFTCILHGSMSVVDNLRKHITRNYVFGFPVFSSVYFNTCYFGKAL